MSEQIDAFNSIPEGEFPCPLQIVHKHAKGEEKFNKYYNEKCLRCIGNASEKDKPIEHKLLDTMIRFKIMANFKQIVKAIKILDVDDKRMPTGIDLFMKMTGQSN